MSMDAISLALEVGHLLKQYSDAVQSVDETIKDLQLQIDGLTQVLQNLTAVVSSRDFEALRMPGSEGLKENVPNLIGNCQETLRRVAEAARELCTSGKSNIWKKGWRGAKLMYSHKDIEDLLALLKTHSMNLQMALTTANLCDVFPSHRYLKLTERRMVTVHSPRALAAEQSQHFEKLEGMLVVIADQMRVNANFPHTPSDATMASLKPDQYTKKLTSFAMNAMSSASTARGSVSGRTLVAGDEPAFDFIGDKKNIAGKTSAPPVKLYQESTTGSEFGEPMSATKSSQLQDWIDEASPFEARPPSPDPAEYSRQDSARTTASQSSIGSIFSSVAGGWIYKSDTRGSETPSQLFTESGDEASEEFEIAQRKFKKANEQLAFENSSSAAKLFDEGFRFAEKLGLRDQEKLDVAGMKLTYATSLSQLFSKEAKEEKLRQLAQMPPTTATVLERQLSAIHELARLKFDENELDSAEDYCKQALKGRRTARTIGNKHADYFASLRLYVDILSAKKDYAGARSYADLLPTELKGDLDRRFSILQKTQAPRQNSLEPTPPPLPPRDRSRSTGAIRRVPVPDARRDLSPVPPPLPMRGKSPVRT